MKLSFCIPTFNRPYHLLKTIKSICSSEKYSSEYEVCIYNNCSNFDYSELEKEIHLLSSHYNVIYKTGSYKLNIDQSMYEAINLARGEYVFLLGDDDFLTKNGIEEIFSLLNESKFELAVFNAIRVSDSNSNQSELIGVNNKIFEDFETAFLELKEFCTYGNLLLKRELINDNDFKYLFGTSHAYGCFWLSFFRDYENGLVPKIIIPHPSVVCLTYVEKNYDIMDVTFRHSYLEHKLYFDIIGEKSKKLLAAFELKLNKRISSIMFFIQLGVNGNNLRRIREINFVFYKKNRLKIFIAELLVSLAIFFKKPLKRMLTVRWLHNFVYTK